MTVEEAFEKKLIDVPLTIEGSVVEILTDDIDITPHQRFIVEVHSGHTVLVAHSTERAYRIPVKIGDKVEIHGTYKWNGKGGLIHKTHHDEQGKHEDGWINFAGKMHR